MNAVAKTRETTYCTFAGQLEEGDHILYPVQQQKSDVCDTSYLEADVLNVEQVDEHVFLVDMKTQHGDHRVKRWYRTANVIVVER